MSDPNTNTLNQDGNDTSDKTSDAGDEFKAITSQDDLNKILNERLRRERDKFADYKDLQAKASKLDKIEEASKTEIDRAMDRVTKAEAEVTTIPARVADALRTHLVGLHEINTEDAELFLTASDPDLLLKQVQRLTDRESGRKKTGNHASREGTNTTSAENEERVFTRELFGT